MNESLDETLRDAVEPANIVSRCNRNHDIEAVNGADIHNLTRSA